jgi:hypothetical protein
MTRFLLGLPLRLVLFAMDRLNRPVVRCPECLAQCRATGCRHLTGCSYKERAR